MEWVRERKRRRMRVRERKGGRKREKIQERSVAGPLASFFQNQTNAAPVGSAHCCLLSASFYPIFRLCSLHPFPPSLALLLCSSLFISYSHSLVSFLPLFGTALSLSCTFSLLLELRTFFFPGQILILMFLFLGCAAHTCLRKRGYMSAMSLRSYVRICASTEWWGLDISLFL